MVAAKYPTRRFIGCYSTSRTLVSLERIQKMCLSTQHLFVRSGSLNGHPRTDFFRNRDAHATHIRSKPSRRRSSRYKPHLFACPLCGVIRVGVQRSLCIPSWVTYRATTIAPPRTAGKLFNSIFKWKKSFYYYQVWCKR